MAKVALSSNLSFPTPIGNPVFCSLHSGMGLTSSRIFPAIYQPIFSDQGVSDQGGIGTIPMHTIEALPIGNTS